MSPPLDGKSHSLFELLGGETYMFQVDSRTGCIDRLLHDQPIHTQNDPGDYIDTNFVKFVN